MSNMSRVVIIIAVLVVFGGATWWYVKTGEENETVLPVGNQASSPVSNQSAQVSAANSTDVAIGVDLQNVDAQLKNLDADNSAVEQGLSDKPIVQLQ